MFTRKTEIKRKRDFGAENYKIITSNCNSNGHRNSVDPRLNEGEKLLQCGKCLMFFYFEGSMVYGLTAVSGIR